jgi:hypothetical protein
MGIFMSASGQFFMSADKRLLIKAMRNQALALNSQRPPHRRHQTAGHGRLSTPEEPVPW